jgi:hypothetical protein
MLLVFVIIALSGIFILEAVLAEIECFGWATLILIMAAVSAHLFHIVDLLTLVRTHALGTIYFIGLYFIAGVVWSFAKWFFFLRGFLEMYRQKKEEWLENRANHTGALLVGACGRKPAKVYGSVSDKNEAVASLGAPLSDAQLSEEFLESIKYQSYRDNSLGRQPKASNNKARITAWIAFWPFSLVGTLVNDPVRRLVDFLFNQFKALYQRMSDAIFSSNPELK